MNYMVVHILSWRLVFRDVVITFIDQAHHVFTYPNICTQRNKLPNLESNSWFSLPGSYYLTIRLSCTCPQKGRCHKPISQVRKGLVAFMTIIPGDLKLEFVYIKWRTGPPSQDSLDEQEAMTK